MSLAARKTSTTITVHLKNHLHRIVLAGLIGFCAALCLSKAHANNVDGAWTGVYDWPLITVHAVITPDGRILSYGTKANGQQTGYFIYDVWDPTAGLSGGHLTLNNMTLTDLFCSSQIILPQSGEILIAGGDNWTGSGTTNTGNNNSNIFDFGDNSLARSANMNRARWYSSSTALLNGDIYIQGGSGGGDYPEVRQTDGAFRLLTSASTSGYSALFPRNFLAPDGRVFGYDTNGKMYFVDTNGSGSLASAGQYSSSYAGWQSSAAMFRPGKILQISANSSGVLVIDINGPTPTWTPTQSTSSMRKWVSATVLADGRVLATGGSEVDNQLTNVNYTAEIWDPDTGLWHVGPLADRARLYHSAALLLPDGSVLVSGGGAPGPQNNTNAEIYYPPYLYASGGGFATRPQIVSAPDTANVGDSLAVQVDTTNISRVTLTKTGSVTHSVNMDQRFLELPFTGSGTMLNVSLPVRASDTPPGYYLMFVIDDSGVPSVASMLRINIDPTPNTAVDYTPTIGGSGGSQFQLACNADEILVGVYGNYATYINQIGPQCVTMDQLGRWIGDPVDRPLTGTTTSGASFRRTCLRDFAMSGFRGRAGTYVNQLDIECRALTPTGGLTGAGQFLGADGGSGGSAQGPHRCGTDNPVYALYGRSGSRVDNFGALCRLGVITPISINSEPVVVNPGTQSGTVGLPIDLQINASDGDGDDLTYGATGLPPGLIIDTATGRITGMPTSDGTFAVEITVSDGTDTATANFDWNIALYLPLSVDPMPPQAPEVVGTPITYTATAHDGVNVVFKWDFDDGGSETAYSSTSSIQYPFTNPGIHYVTLTVNDDFGVPQIQTFVQAIHLPLTANSPGSSTKITYEEKLVGNSRVWVVNQDNDSVSVFDTVTNVKLMEIPVGDAPRSVGIAPDGRVWVTNKSSATISIIDSDSYVVAQTVPMPFASQPYGIVFSPTASEAYVVLEATGKLLKLDALSGAQLGSVDTGPHPRHVAIDGAGASVYVPLFVTARQPGEETAFVQSEVSGVKVGGEVKVVDSATMTVVNTIVLQHGDLPDAESQGRGVPNYLGPPAISPDGTAAWVPSKQDNIGRGTLRDGNNINFQNTVRAIGSRIDMSTVLEDYPSRIDFDNSSVATAVVYDHLGIYAFVALETSREVAVVDAHSSAELFNIDVGRAPQGLAISPDGLKLYVSNFMDRSIDVFDLDDLQTNGQWNVPKLATLQTVSSETLSPQVLQGKQFFYDAKDTRLALHSYISCATCHNDGVQDGRVWDLTGMGEGLRNTISLKGHAGAQGPLHWSENFDEIQDFEGQIRALSGGTGLMADVDFFSGTHSQPLGDPKAGISADLDALAAYVESLNEYASSPYRNSDGTLTADAIAGREIFQIENCGDCHNGPDFTDSAANNLHDIGTLKPSSGTRLGGPLTGIDTPTLRDVWNTAPYLHDGSADTLDAAVQAHTVASVDPADMPQLVAYLKQIDSSSIGFGCQDCTDLSTETTIPFSTQDIDGNFTVLNGGASIRLAGNTWRQSAGTYTITPDTMLEFVFESSSEGEVHGIGFDENNILSANRIFRVYGTQNWGIDDFADYPGSGPKLYQIPVGRYYTGTGMHMVFANDNDAGVGSNSIFTNVRVYEYVPPPTAPIIDDPGDQFSAQGNAISLSVTASDVNGDSLTFSAIGLPAGLDIEADGTISGTPTALGTYNVTVTVDDGNGGSDNTNFDWTIYAPAPGCLDCLDFIFVSTSAYSSQDYDSGVAVEDNGAALVLTDNTWRQTDMTFDITADTILELDFESTVEGEVQGIGFDENTNWKDTDRVFKLYGTQTWGITDFNSYPGSGVTHYQIPVGQYYTGSAMRLVFANDDDAGGGSNSRYSNVRVFDGSSGNIAPTISNPGDRNTAVNSNVSLIVAANDLNPGDILSFSGLNLPPGLSINSSTGEISGIAGTLGTYNVTITVDDGNGGSDSANFAWTVFDPNISCPDCLDFNVVTTSSYSSQDYAANYLVTDAGSTLVLMDNTWRQTDQTFNVTANTVIEFDFESTAEGEVQGIGLDENTNWKDADRIFKVYGTQTWGITVFDNYSGSGQSHYQIPVGQYYTGAAMRLVFANDDDANTGSNGRFTNVRVYDSPPN